MPAGQNNKKNIKISETTPSSQPPKTTASTKGSKSNTSTSQDPAKQLSQNSTPASAESKKTDSKQQGATRAPPAKEHNAPSGHSRRPQPKVGVSHPIVTEDHILQNLQPAAPAKTKKKKQKKGGRQETPPASPTNTMKQQFTLGSTSATLTVVPKIDQSRANEVIEATFYRDATPQQLERARSRWAARQARKPGDQTSAAERDQDDIEATLKWAHPIDGHLRQVAGLVPEQVISYNPYGADVLGWDPYSHQPRTFEYLESLQQLHDQFVAEDNQERLPRFEDPLLEDEDTWQPQTPIHQSAAAPHVVVSSATPPTAETSSGSMPHVPGLGYGPHLGFHNPASYQLSIRVGQDTICPLVAPAPAQGRISTPTESSSQLQQQPGAVLVRFHAATGPGGPTPPSMVSTPNQSLNGGNASVTTYPSVGVSDETISPLESGIYDVASLSGSVNVPTPNNCSLPQQYPMSYSVPLSPHGQPSLVPPPPLQQRYLPQPFKDVVATATPSLFASPPSPRSDEASDDSNESSLEELRSTSPSSRSETGGGVLKFHPCRPVSAYSYFRQLAVALIRRESKFGQLSVTQVNMMSQLKLNYPTLCEVSISNRASDIRVLPTEVTGADPRATWDRPTTWEEFFQGSLGLNKFLYAEHLLRRYHSYFMSQNEARLSWVENPIVTHVEYDLTVRNNEVLDAAVNFMWKFYEVLLDLEDLSEGAPLLGPFRLECLWPEFLRCPFGTAYFSHNPSACSKNEMKHLFRELNPLFVNEETHRMNHSMRVRTLEELTRRFAQDRREKEAISNNRQEPAGSGFTRQRAEKLPHNQRAEQYAQGLRKTTRPSVPTAGGHPNRRAQRAARKKTASSDKDEDDRAD